MYNIPSSIIFFSCMLLIAVLLLLFCNKISAEFLLAFFLSYSGYISPFGYSTESQKSCIVLVTSQLYNSDITGIIVSTLREQLVSSLQWSFLCFSCCFCSTGVCSIIDFYGIVRTYSSRTKMT